MKRPDCAFCGHPASRHFTPRPADTYPARLEGCGVRGEGHGWRCPCPGYVR